MHLLGVVLTVLGAWLILAVPVALLMGRFLQVGSDPSRLPVAQPRPDDSFGSTAA